MKNILVDMHRLKQNPFNGLYTFSYNLGKSLAALSSGSLKLHFYLPKDKFGIFGSNSAYEAHQSIDKFYMPGTSKFDVWHATTTISWYKPFNKKTRFIFTIHDLNFLIEDSANVSRNRRMLKRIQERVDRADHITGISQYALDMAAQHLNMRGKPQTVIYNGSNVKDFPLFDSPRYRPVKPFLFTIGLVQPRKNFHLLPALLKGNDYELIISGLNQYEYGKVVEMEIKKQGMEGRVKLTGPITEEEKYWYYKNCTAFLFPSFAEGFGLPAIEAMQLGKPVFLSNRTCMPEIGGDAAYYFDNFDQEAMRKVFVDGMADYQQNDPVEKIKKRAAIFNWDISARQYLDVYRNLL
ncbi:MAG: glycosyltransferase family 1 protein [Ferruginibacter sp.]